MQQQPSTSDLESISSEEKEDGGNHKWRSAKSYLMQLSQREQANFAFLYSQLDHTSTVEELIELLRFAKSNKVSAHLPLLFFINESKVMRCLPEQDDQAYFARVVKELGIKLIGKLAKFSGPQFDSSSTLDQLRNKFDSTRLLGDLEELN